MRQTTKIVFHGRFPRLKAAPLIHLASTRDWMLTSLSNELSNPKVVRSPRDNSRNQANSFVTKKPKGAAGRTVVPFGLKGNYSFSYTIGSEADESKPNNILSATRNIVFGRSTTTTATVKVQLRSLVSASLWVKALLAGLKASMRIKETSSFLTHQFNRQAAANLSNT